MKVPVHAQFHRMLRVLPLLFLQGQRVTVGGCGTNTHLQRTHGCFSIDATVVIFKGCGGRGGGGGGGNAFNVFHKSCVLSDS